MDDGRTIEMTRPMRRIEARIGRPIEDELTDRYLRQGQTLAEIGAALGVSEATVSRWLHRVGIEARFPGQRAKVA